MRKISEYVSMEEYACSCCGKLPPDFYDEDGVIAPEYALLFWVADWIRREYGFPIRWSGFRCSAHNKEVGGEGLSVHLFGLALDGDVPNQEDAKKCAKIAKAHPYRPRVGWKKYLKDRIDKNGNRIKQSFFHIDLGFLICPRATEKWHRGAEW